MEAHGIPVLILKSERDTVAKYVPRIYDNSHAQVIDITDQGENDMFREHLYHMVNPLLTTVVIEQFVSQTEEARAIPTPAKEVAA
jgi:fructoselysine-6-P-deglycase FrlB-like protein